MANASRKHMSPGHDGKGDGSGAMSELPPNVLPENMPLSNRDKKRHSDERGLDSKRVQTDQFQDHAANRIDGAQMPAEPHGNADPDVSR